MSKITQQIKLTKDVKCLRKTFKKGEILTVTHNGKLPKPSNIGVSFFIHNYNSPRHMETILWWNEFEILTPSDQSTSEAG